MSRTIRAWIDARGARTIEHPGGTLFDHLVRVEALLRSWDANDDVCAAGLCHAAYGTDGFATALLPLERRDELARAIGARAERLVYSYACCDRDVAYACIDAPHATFRDRFTGEPFVPDETALRAFAEITAANELDVVRHSRIVAREHGAGLRLLVERMRHLLSPGAIRAWREEPVPR